jgi:superfamily I DNA/RNA helicase
MAGNGPDVIFATGASISQRIESAAAEVRNWLLDPAIEPSQIVLLSPLAKTESSASAIAARAAVPISPWIPGWGQNPQMNGSMAMATIEEFRGLEAPLVVLCDMERHMPDLRRLFYLGLTRANVGLIVVADAGAVQVLALEAAELRRSRKRSAHVS